MLSNRDKAELGVYPNFILNGGAEESTSGWLGYNENQTVTITNASPAVFTVSSTTGFYNGMPIAFKTSGSLPTGLTAGTVYYISNLGTDGANKFRVSASLGGSEVNTSSAGSGTHTAMNLVPLSGSTGSLSGLTFSRNTSTPLDGNADFKLLQSNSTVVAGQGISYPFTIDPAYQAQVMSLRFNFNASSTFVASNGQLGTIGTSGVDSDLEFWIYDVTNSVLIPISPKVITANGSNNFTFKGTFQTSNNSTSYRILMHTATTNNNATGWTFKWDNVYLGPQPIVQGLPGTDWTPYTPTITSFGTPTNVEFEWRRIGDTLHVRGKFTSGSSTASEARWSFPSGLVSADTTTIPSIQVCGNAAHSVATARYYVMLIEPSVSYFTYGVQSSALAGLNKENGSLISSGESFSFVAQAQIAGWSSNTLMSNDASTRVVAASYSTLSSTTITSGTAIKYTTLVYDTHSAYNTSTGQFTAPVSGWYRLTTCGPFLGSGSTDFNLQVNGVTVYATYGSLGSAGRNTNSITVQVKAGDLITISPNGSATAGSTNSFLTIEQIQGPSQIATIESVNARYYASSTSISGSLATISWTTKDYDSHNGMSSGVYTVPISGKYQINAAILLSGTFALNSTLIMEIQKNGSVVSRFTFYAGGAVTNMKGMMSDQINCLAGDLIRVQVSSSGTGPAVVSSNFDNYISIFRTGN